MFRSWYAVYTKPQKELKVSALLSRRGIENFCPVVNILRGKNGNRKTVSETLFSSIVFVHVSEAEILSLKNFSGIVNVFYWKSKPAVINKEEINALKKLIATYTNVKIEKVFVDHSSSFKMVDDPQISFHENMVSVKYETIKINLPSLGYRVIAQRAEEENVTEQETRLLSSFPKRINAFFFN